MSSPGDLGDMISAEISNIYSHQFEEWADIILRSSADMRRLRPLEVVEFFVPQELQSSLISRSYSNLRSTRVGLVDGVVIGCYHAMIQQRPKPNHLPPTPKSTLGWGISPTIGAFHYTLIISDFATFGFGPVPRGLR